MAGFNIILLTKCLECQQSLERFLLFLTTLELREGFRGSGSGLREQFKHIPLPSSSLFLVAHL